MAVHLLAEESDFTDTVGALVPADYSDEAHETLKR